MNDSNFWNDKKESEKVISKLNELKRILNETKEIKKKIESNLEILNELKEEYDEELKILLEQDAKNINSKLEELEIDILLNGPYDKLDAVLELHSGAGGTEACDWASMLYRMYMRWCEKKDIKQKLLIYKKVMKQELKVLQ